LRIIREPFSPSFVAHHGATKTAGLWLLPLSRERGLVQRGSLKHPSQLSRLDDSSSRLSAA